MIWGGEFGRTSMMEARDGSTYLGRDHHPKAFTMLFAGGGMKPGFIYGETDDFGYFVTKNEMTVRDLQATMLHLLGLRRPPASATRTWASTSGSSARKARPACITR